jgi:DNA-binding GntR family transcriptional regulator
MATAAEAGRPEPGKLSRKLASRIVEHLAENQLFEGSTLTELGLAETLNVSRTPVRTALEQLEGSGIVARIGPRRGYRVLASGKTIASLAQDSSGTDEEEDLYLAIAQDFIRQRSEAQFSEADMLRRYGVGRSLLMRVLQRMAGDRVIERNPGYGWRFAPLLRSVESHDESYRFRLAIEPAALEEPNFVLDRVWAARTRKAHEAVLAEDPARVSMVRFFAMNADFHETLAACSGNSFFHQAVQQQNQIRRFQNYAWTYGPERIATCCHEHLDILAACENNEQGWAATLMRRHLDLACRLKPAAE